MRFFEFLPNRWGGIFSTKKIKRVTQKRRCRDRAGCMRVRLRLRWVCSTSQNTQNSTSRGQISRVSAMFIILRNDSGLPVMERRSSTKCVLHSTPSEKAWKRNAPHIWQLCRGLPPIILPQSCWKNTKVSDRPERLMLPRNVWQRPGRLWKERSVWTCLPSFNIWKQGSGKQMPLDWKQLLSWRDMVLNRAVCAKTSKNVPRWRGRCWRDADMLHHDWQALSNYTHN